MATPPRANLSREEPDAGNLHVRVCEGWGRQRPHLLGDTTRLWRISVHLGRWSRRLSLRVLAMYYPTFLARKQARCRSASRSSRSGIREVRYAAWLVPRVDEGAGIMRLLIAMMKHETNTFSPVPTPLARFGPSYSDRRPGPLYGEAAIQAYRGTGSGLGAYLDLAEREKADIVLPIAASAPPSRPVEDAAYEHIADIICDAVAKGGYDGMFLDLHGAMVTESFEDGEGELLRRIRAIDPKTPIAVSLDMHANLYDAMIENATVVTGYRTYPHIDTYDTAKRAGDILLRAMRGEVSPVMAWGNVPMLPHVMRQGSDDHPNKELQARCAAIASEAALDASLFTGFPHADITNAGLSALVVTDGDRALAEKLRDELLD